MAKADFQRAKTEYPSTGMGEKGWLAFFDTSEGTHEERDGRIEAVRVDVPGAGLP